MFFDLQLAARKTETFIRELPPVPYTTWQPPQYLPELRNAKVIGFDTETKETDFDHGPGWARGEGHIIGVSIAAIMSDNSRCKWYFPVRHEVEREYNLDAKTVFDWLRVMLNTPHIPKVGANLLYDCGWLSTENIFPSGPLYDVQFAEALIDEEGLVALDHLGRKYLNRGKQQDLCKEWILSAYPKANNDNWRGYLWRTPPRLAGPYAEDDAELPLDILWKQWDVMTAEQTLELFKMECRGIPMYVRMRMQGVPVDIAKAEMLRDTIQQEIKVLYSTLSYKTATQIDNVTAPTQLAKAFDAAGIAYPRTATRKPSFRKEWLKLLSEDPVRDPNGVGKLINDIREREKLRDTFIDSYILGRARVDRGSNGLGRIYCSFHPLRGDENGAKTGRLSSSDPNLQNIPSRTELGKEVRDVFIPEYGHHCWHKKDHSQIEYRAFAHYAVGPRSDEMRYRYNNDPSTDYHNDTMLDVAAMRNMNLAAMSTFELASFRKPIKNVNFGLLYGQTEPSLAYKAGWSRAEADDFFGVYHGARPFVKTTMTAIQHEVQYNGYITTILGRRTRFNRWSPKGYHNRVLNDAGKPMNFAHEEATRRWGSNIERAFAYRGVNYRFQGTSADILKAGMLQCYEEGVFDYIGLPKLTVHDELDWSKISNDNAMNDAFRYAAHVMENTIKLRVPLKVDTSEGATWGEAA